MPAVALQNVPQLRPDQARIALALDEYDVVVASMGRRWGKTVLGLVLVLGALLFGMRVAWVVPIYKNSRPLWRAVLHAVAPLVAVGRARVSLSERIVETWNGGMLAIYSADSADAIRGEWFHLVVIDEAARIPEDVMAETIAPTVADVGGKLVDLSTPRGKNWFWREYEHGIVRSNQTISFTAPSEDNPNPRIQRAAHRARQRFGEDSETYQQEWRGAFVDAAGTAWLRSWAEDRYDPDDLATTQAVIARILSYDTANKKGETNSFTVCTVADLLPDYRLLVRHVWRERLLFPGLVDAMNRDLREWNADGKLWAVLIEDQASGTQLYQTLYATGDDTLKEKLYPITPRVGKDQRFQTSGVWVKNGRVLLPRPSASVRWLHALEAELFEEGEYKDQRDSISQVINWMADYLEAGLPRPGEAA